MIGITGANGFIGAHLLCYAIKNQVPVKALVRERASILFFQHLRKFYNLNKEEVRKYITWVDINNRDPYSYAEALKGCTALIHTAGFVCFDDYYADELLLINQRITKKLVNAALAEEGLSHFVYLSSIAALPEKKRKTEKLAKQFSTCYGLSKYLGELEVIRAKEEGLKTSIIQPGIVVGPCPKDHSLGQWIALMEKGFAYTGSGSSGFTDYKLLCDLCFEGIRQEAQPQTLVHDNLTYKEFANKVLTAIGKKGKAKTLPKWFFSLASWISLPIDRLKSKQHRLPKSSVNSLFSKSQYPCSPNGDLASAIKEMGDFYKN